ncbi:HlyD family secretion protein [Breznakibacter xylanolyticus]|uniref:HlyD family secretion protein n=1 Tax=Breznakibacter xylanolyticus TaxID=990 RepID=A0A2W7Q804_9BACT|nr:HlyD family efflux transporter periplasmic adaptor subunit [Breznakibacter xylanolyticus]PZX17879.1 HlyD family secretion protein [Breznakibacter xylanolyticus]
MKRFKYSYIWMMLLLSSCGNGNHRSDAYGNFESTEIIISAEAAGKVMAVFVEEGDPVMAGDVICLIDTVPLHLQKQQLIAGKTAVMTGMRKISTAIDVQKAQKQMLENDLVRLEKMKAGNAATAKQYDDATGQMDVIDRQIDNTRAQLDGIHAELTLADAKIASLNDQLTRCTVKAPQVGTILSKLTEVGELLTPGRPIVKLANLNPMILRAYISGDMLPQVKIGHEVNVLIDRDGNANDTLPGTITWVSSTAEFTPKIIQTKQERVNQVYAFKVTVPNDGRIKIGMPGEVVLIK